MVTDEQQSDGRQCVFMLVWFCLAVSSPGFPLWPPDASLKALGGYYCKIMTRRVFLDSGNLVQYTD